MKKLLAFVMAAAMLLSCVVVGTSAADVWDGTTVATEFAGGNGTEATPYVIKTAAQLKYLSNQVAGGESYEGKHFVLGDDINLGKHEWTPIGGNGTAPDFKGNFDGKGYTISGLKISNTAQNKFAGLFGIVRGNTYLKNLVIADSEIDASSIAGSCAGAVAGYIDVDEISSIVVERDVSVSAGDSGGGVFGRITGGTATYIVNNASVTVGLTYAGGISGTLSGGATISYSANHGNVGGAAKFAGGIIGLIAVNGNEAGGTTQTQGGSIISCYNDGDVSSEIIADKAPFIGGIVGRLGANSLSGKYTWEYKLVNVYNFGDVSSPKLNSTAQGETAWGAGEITGQVHMGTVTLTDCYSVDFAKVALIKHIGKAYEDGLESVQNMNEAEITALEGYKDILAKIKGGLAVATYTVTFDSVDGTPIPPAQTVASGSTATEPTPAPTKTGYTFMGWKNGSTDYDFSTPVTAHLTLIAQWKQTAVQPITYTVTFNSDGGSAVAAQSNIASGQPVAEPTAPTKEGYEFLGWYAPEATEPYDFTTPVTADLTLTAKWKEKAVQPTTYTVAVANNIQNGTVAADKATAAAGDTVTLTVTPAAGYEIESISVNGNVITGTTFTMPAENVTITAAFKQKPSVSVPDGSKDKPFVISTAEQLKNLSAEVAAGNSYEGKYFILGSDIDLNDQEWTPIGISGSKAFKGNFDGQGHTVSGIKVSNAQSYGALFGCVITDGYFKNLVIADSDISSARYAGAAAAYIAASEVSAITVKEDVNVVSADSIGGVFGRIVGGNFTHIVNYATVRGNYGVYNVSFAGGICGTLGGNATLTYSANYGKVGGALYNGGLAGITGANKGGATVKNCYNRGIVEHTGTENVFVGGIVGSIGLKNQTYTHSFENVYNLGTVSKTYNSAKRIGEITGHIPAGTIKLKNVYVLDDENVGLIFKEEKVATISKTNVATKTQAEIEQMTSTILSAIAANAPKYAYAVAFFDDGGVVYTQYMNPGEKVSKPADPIKDGCTFKGWYNGTEAYNFDAPVVKDLTLTAEWEQVSGAKDDNIFSSPLFALAALYAQRYDVQLIGEHCSISGDTVIKYKRSGTVEISVDEGYEIVDVVANGEALGPVTAVTFKKVTRNPELVVLTRVIEKIN